MIENNRIVAIIPARGGSKGIPKKNIQPLMGKPLIGYTIEAATGSKYVDSVIVSTDDEEIAKISKEYGAEVPFMRPKWLSDDNAKTIDAIMHALEELKSAGRNFDLCVLLQPTSPLRNSDDIDNAIEYLCCNDLDNLVAICEVDDHPLLIRKIGGPKGKLCPLVPSNSTVRRQDFEHYYKVCGALYINHCCRLSRETSLNDNGYGWVIEKSHAVDIDELVDFRLADFFLEELGSSKKSQ